MSTVLDDPFGVSIDKYFKKDFYEVKLDLDRYFLNKDIHVMGTWHDPLLCALDVAKYIDDSDHYNRSIKTNLEKDIDYVELTPEGRSKTFYFTEQGLYRYLMHSNKPKCTNETIYC